MARATETKQIPIYLLVKLFPEMQTQIPIGVQHEIQQTSWCIVDTSYVKVLWRVKRLTNGKYSWGNLLLRECGLCNDVTHMKGWLTYIIYSWEICYCATCGLCNMIWKAGWPIIFHWCRSQAQHNVVNVCMYSLVQMVLSLSLTFWHICKITWNQAKHLQQEG